ncbi:Sec-independent protein translocase protein TatB [Campylobacter sp. VicNov18]|uniref:Sec-independent protein translocase protein TatB n=1 Tax=Campylobacter bilis TaxID=2691918 RepID=UPI00130E754D|nr:Sec-independent protein translocase protein TatB [Campylobacter bilis]MPV63386.1 Sec-independent protein translocase subunit TatB [Campylobacter hepaticus]MBM0636885.1 Sec-independent protein translocase subunit TatB [Campylobacter bilis]MCC8277594.1 Sec-independent protein translocase protein TatB [Campylobacter bilis]MCC8299203.1 Sec-independent protein translocase protein TatB [Campylobacter bilis]MCC8300503.1 Sec-independent protein translocase protein TatB [Campylobacter bilis]
MSFSEIIVILIVAILVLGPEKLPQAIVQIAKILKAIKRNIDDAKSSIEKEIRINDLKEEAKKYKDEFSSANENIRKKLSFEEFDDLKRDILEKTKANSSTHHHTNSDPKDTKIQNPMEK